MGKVVLLLCENVEEERMGLWRKEVTEETKKQLWLAGPMIFVCVFQFSLQMISVMFIGHLSELFLASVSLSTSIANATGFNVMVSSYHFFCVLVYQLVTKCTFEMKSIYACQLVCIYIIIYQCIPKFCISPEDVSFSDKKNIKLGTNFVVNSEEI